MLISMTDFGRAVCDAPFGRLVVEIQSVNRKYLEIAVSVPKELNRFEHEVRKWVGDVVSRGQVTVRVFLSSHLLEVSLPNIDLLRSLKQGWEKVSLELGFDPKSITLPFLMQYIPQQTPEAARDEDLPALRSCVEEALQGLVQMKKTEGNALREDIGGRIKELQRMIDAIETLAPDATLRMRQKLFEKMEEVLKGGSETEERLLREVALFAERVDISEEITRFRSHVAQFHELLSPKGGVVGRKIDFLIQEMSREINTIGSKSMEPNISHLVVNMKSELEKIREQIQNIE